MTGEDPDVTRLNPHHSPPEAKSTSSGPWFRAEETGVPPQISSANPPYYSPRATHRPERPHERPREPQYERPAEPRESRPSESPTPRPAQSRRRRRRGPQKSNTGLIAAAVTAGALVIALVAGLIVIATQTTPNAPPKAADTPEQVVEKYFAALSDADAERAIALQAGEVSASELLTDEVLRRSAEIAPITDVKVQQTGPSEVLVDYRIGDTPTQATFPVVQDENGDWQLASVTTMVQLTRPKNVPVLINDVAVTNDTMEAFPGAYQVSTSLTNITYDAEPVVIDGPSSFPVIQPKPQLTDAGVQAFREAVIGALDECMQRRELEPKNCPQNVPAGPQQEVDTATIKWELLDDPMTDFNPKLSDDDRTVAETDLRFNVSLSVFVKTPDGEGDVSQDYEFLTTARGSVVNDPIKVTFD